MHAGMWMYVCVYNVCMHEMLVLLVTQCSLRGVLTLEETLASVDNHVGHSRVIIDISLFVVIDHRDRGHARRRAAGRDRTVPLSLHFH